MSFRGILKLSFTFFAQPCIFFLAVPELGRFAMSGPTPPKYLPQISPNSTRCSLAVTHR